MIKLYSKINCGLGPVGSKSHCRAVPAVPSPIWCASNLIFIDDVSFKL